MVQPASNRRGHDAFGESMRAGVPAFWNVRGDTHAEFQLQLVGDVPQSRARLASITAAETSVIGNTGSPRHRNERGQDAELVAHHL